MLACAAQSTVLSHLLILFEDGTALECVCIALEEGLAHAGPLRLNSIHAQRQRTCERRAVWLAVGLDHGSLGDHIGRTSYIIEASTSVKLVQAHLLSCKHDYLNFICSFMLSFIYRSLPGLLFLGNCFELQYIYL